MCGPLAGPYVPDSFWIDTLEKSLMEAIENYKKYEDKINKSIYMYDLSKTLVSFGIK